MKIILFCIPLLFYSQTIQLNNINSSDAYKLISKYKQQKAVLINFWATWCAPCVEEFPNIVRLQQKYPDELIVIFISFDILSNRTEVLRFLKKNNVDWLTYIKSESDDQFIQNMPEVWDGALPFSMIFRLNGKNEIYLTGKQDFDTFNKYTKRAIKNGGD